MTKKERATLKAMPKDTHDQIEDRHRFRLQCIERSRTREHLGFELARIAAIVGLWWLIWP